MGTALESLLLSGNAAFLPKHLEVLFHITAGEAPGNQSTSRYTMCRYLDITLARLRGPAGGAVRGAGGCGGQPAGRLAGQETAAKQGQNPRPLLRHPGSGTSCSTS